MCINLATQQEAFIFLGDGCQRLFQNYQILAPLETHLFNSYLLLNQRKVSLKERIETERSVAVNADPLIDRGHTGPTLRRGTLL